MFFLDFGVQSRPVRQCRSVSCVALNRTLCWQLAVTELFAQLLMLKAHPDRHHEEIVAEFARH